MVGICRKKCPNRQPDIIRAVKQKLESLRDAGVSHIPKARSREQAGHLRSGRGAGSGERAGHLRAVGEQGATPCPASHPSWGVEVLCRHMTARQPRPAPCSPLPALAPRSVLPAPCPPLPAPRSPLPAPRGGPGRSGQAGGRLHALPGAGAKSHADGFRRRQSPCQAGLCRRGPGRGRRSAGRTVRRPGGSIAYRHHHQRHETPPRGRLHHEHPPLPAAGQSHAAAG